MYWQRRLTRLELAVYAGLIGIALAVFADRLLDTLEIAERAAMDVTVSRVNSAINIQLAADRFGGRLPRIAEALERNPFEVARMSPGNFLGEFDAPQLDGLERGTWIFDRSSRELIYLPKLHRGLEAAEPAVRFRLERRGNELFALVPAAPYMWRAM